MFLVFRTILQNLFLSVHRWMYHPGLPSLSSHLCNKGKAILM